jgi:hypothetical protein
VLRTLIVIAVSVALTGDAFAFQIERRSARSTIKRKDLRLTIDPSHFAMPTPQLSGLPFYYRQHRITVGVEYRFE